MDQAPRPLQGGISGPELIKKDGLHLFPLSVSFSSQVSAHVSAQNRALGAMERRHLRERGRHARPGYPQDNLAQLSQLITPPVLQVCRATSSSVSSPTLHGKGTIALAQDQGCTEFSLPAGAIT